MKHLILPEKPKGPWHNRATAPSLIPHEKLVKLLFDDEAILACCLQLGAQLLTGGGIASRGLQAIYLATTLASAFGHHIFQP